MPQLLTYYARLLIQDRKILERVVDVPVLVWEPREGDEVVKVSALTSATNDLALATSAGAPSRRPKSGDALVFEIRKGQRNALLTGLTIGRADTNDVCVPDSSVSRLHAIIARAPNRDDWLLTDKGSRNGTWINALKLKPEEPAVLTAGALVQLGSVRLIFHKPLSFVQYVEGVTNR